MRFSEAWLREWVDPPVTTAELAEQLTMAGLEVGSVEPAAAEFSGVVLGRVIAVAAHPDADKLRVCQVDVGEPEPRNIVCGAPNVAANQLVAVARAGAVLPGGLIIKKAELRGVESDGMICSARELLLSEEADGILVLPDGGKPGQCLRDYLALDDNVIALELTPNRGDCLGLAGIAREVGVLNRMDVRRPAVAPVPARNQDQVAINLDDEQGCPVYAGRVIRGIDNKAVTPFWLQERLRRSGLRSIHPVVDVTNYVMLETGQPMHAFDLASLHGAITVRRADDGEKLTLLDGREVTLDEEVLVIADESGARALAGIMGGADSAVGPDTSDIFFESAFFSPRIVAGRARRFGMHTDASYRFERGVAPGGQLDAIERATALLIGIAGGAAGPAVQAGTGKKLRKSPSVLLRRRQLDRLLGTVVADGEVSEILTRLGMQVEPVDQGWRATPPAFRFDIAIEADLIEEVARIHGYDRIPAADAADPLPVAPDTETRVPQTWLESVLVGRGYREVITYSFVEPGLQTLLGGGEPGLALSNPISAELAVMRTSLWPGLVQTLQQNLSRQQERVRLFESGLRYIPQGNEIKQEKCLSGLIYGAVLPEQWGSAAAGADFFDLKGDVEALLALTGAPDAFRFAPDTHPALHPGQSARVLRRDTPVGWIGALHPGHQRLLGLNKPAFVFEILVAAAFRAKIPSYGEISRFPSVRRDISMFIDESVSAAEVVNCVRKHAPGVLRQIRIFDVYREQEVDSGRKSVALGLILQDYCSTLTDREADAAVDAVRAGLVENLNAKIRD